MGKFLKKILYFFTGYFFVVLIINLLAPYHWGNPWYSSKIHYLERKKIEQNPNFYFFGSSRVYRQINPNLIDSVLNKQIDQDVMSFNLGAPATFYPQSFYLYENFLKSELAENTDYVLIELSSLDEIPNNLMHEERTYYYQNLFDLMYVFKSVVSNNEFNKKEKITITNKYLLSFIEKNVIPANFKHNWLNDDYYKVDYVGLEKNGFYPLDEELIVTNDHLIRKHLNNRKGKLLIEKLRNREKRDSLSYNLKEYSMNGSNSLYLDRLKNLIDLSSEKGIHLMFLISARGVSEEILAVAKKIPKKNLIDLGNPEKYKYIYDIDYSFDLGHLNSKGSNLYSKELGLKIIENLK